jgi:hypothetical protein
MQMRSDLGHDDKHLDARALGGIHLKTSDKDKFFEASNKSLVA